MNTNQMKQTHAILVIVLLTALVFTDRVSAQNDRCDPTKVVTAEAVREMPRQRIPGVEENASLQNV